MKFYPYHIIHCHLNAADTLKPPEVTANAAYIVFWWKEIAIGELFIEHGTNISNEAYFQKVVDIIHPAVEQYAGPTISKSSNLEELKLQLSQIFSAYTEINLPATVDISVVICTRNRPQQIRRCLDSLTRLTCIPAQIIVVDNAPSDDQTKNITAQFPGVTYYREPRPGLDIARNAGIQQSTCPIVAYVDDDVTVHPHWAYWTWKSFEDAAVGAMTGLVLAAQLDTEAQYIFEKEWRFNRGYLNKMYDHQFFNSTLKYGPPVWQIGAGANMAFRKSMLQQTGNFDERLDVGAAGCNGDSELWFRILANGFSIAYNPRSIVAHEHRKEMGALKKQLYNYMRGFTAAALIQQKYNSDAGYYRHLFLRIPKWYLKELGRGFPKYKMRYATIFSEIKGMLSGLLFYRKHRNTKQFN